MHILMKDKKIEAKHPPKQQIYRSDICTAAALKNHMTYDYVSLGLPLKDYDYVCLAAAKL